MAKKKDLKKSIEAEIQKMLASSEEPSEGRMKLLALGIKMSALNAKLEENDYGGFFGEDDPGSVSERKKPASRGRTNGGSDPAAPTE